MLSDKIWVTRKIRIYTEQRLQRTATIAQALMVAYSLALVSLSIWNLQSNLRNLNVISAFASIVVLVLSVYLTAQKYSERSIAMRNCYIQLDELYSRVKRAERDSDTSKLENFESEYSSLLINIENHSEYDYLSLRYSLRDATDTTLPPFNRHDHLWYLWGRAWRGILAAILFAISLPFIILVWV